MEYGEAVSSPQADYFLKHNSSDVLDGLGADSDPFVAVDSLDKGILEINREMDTSAVDTAPLKSTHVKRESHIASRAANVAPYANSLEFYKAEEDRLDGEIAVATVKVETEQNPEQKKLDGYGLAMLEVTLPPVHPPLTHT